MTLLNILLQAQDNPLKPITTLIGFAIAMVWLFYRWGKKNKENKNNEKKD